MAGRAFAFPLLQAHGKHFIVPTWVSQQGLGGRAISAELVHSRLKLQIVTECRKTQLDIRTLLPNIPDPRQSMVRVDRMFSAGCIQCSLGFTCCSFFEAGFAAGAAGVPSGSTANCFSGTATGAFMAKHCRLAALSSLSSPRTCFGRRSFSFCTVRPEGFGSGVGADRTLPPRRNAAAGLLPRCRASAASTTASPLRRGYPAYPWTVPTRRCCRAAADGREDDGCADFWGSIM